MTRLSSPRVFRQFALLGLFAALIGIVAASPAADPSAVTGANYPLANKFSRDFVGQHVADSRGGALVSPQWIGKTDVFYYSVRTPAGTQHWKVDADKRSKVPLFDTAILAGKLSEAAKKPFDAANLPVGQVRVSDDGKKMTFVADEFRYDFEFASSKLTKLGRAPVGPPQQGFGGRGGQLTEEQRRRFEELRDQFQKRDDQQDDQQQEKKDDQKDDQQQEKKDEQQLEKKENQQQKKGTKGGGPPGAKANPADGYKNYSPDRKQYVYAYKHNLYLAEEGKESEAVQLTKDGVEEYGFGGGLGGGFGGRTRTSEDEAQQPPAADRKSRPTVSWSPDSKVFQVTRADTRGVKDLFLVDSIANPRPKLEQYKYPMPGEEKVRKSELFYVSAPAKKVVQIKPKWIDERYSNVQWGKAPGELRFIRRDRLQRNLEYISLDTAAGTEKVLVNEGFDSAFLDFQPPRYIDETDDMLWWSERSGWGHYYRYGRDGTFKNALTSGPWRVSSIVEIDTKNNVIYLRGNAREAGENVYYQHLYRVNFDGTGLTLLDPGNANHSSTLSPSKKYVVDNMSRVDQAPLAVLRDAQGNQLMELEQVDLSRLYSTGWRPPETFMVKAADGVTDLYGNMWKPFDFDENKKYPIITYVYPGPQQEGVTHTFTAHSQYMQLAQLGFIVIQVGHRGGTPQRSKAYHSYGYFNLRDYGLVDKKAAIEQLAARHPFIDISRVGIYGHSGGGFMSAAALLQKPYNEFFKVAVASAGNHDNNIYNDNWSERYHGLKLVAVAEGEQKTTATTGTATGTFGKGRLRKPPGETDDEPVEPAQDKDADQAKRIADLEKQIAEVAKQIEAAKKGTATAKQEEKSDTTGKAEVKTGGAGAAEKKDPPKMKFDIKVPTNAELAANLKGHLMLVHGEIDNNVHPANTMRLVDALIKANKRFDMLIIPGARHGFGAAQGYFTQRMWDFFAEHLLGDRQTKADIMEKDVKRR